MTTTTDRLDGIDSADVIAANVIEHADLAVEYEARTRQIATDPSIWNHWYYDHLRTALRDLSALYPDQTITAMDACGGTGKTALFLQRQGVDVVLCDVSPEMTAVYEKICAELALPARVVLRDIVSYLRDESTPRVHLITFSSALHHLPDYELALALAAEKLEPGGFIHTAWDPLPRTRTVHALSKAEYYLSRFRHPVALGRGAQRRVKRWRRHRAGAAKVNHEFHGGRSGMDDVALIAFARSLGLTVRLHRRNAGGSLRVLQPVRDVLNAHTTFALLLQRPSGGE